MSQGYTKGIPIDVDGTFSANSDGLIPSQKAVKTYVDTGLATKQATLTGSESVLLPSRALFKQNIDISHTGTLTETIIANFLVSAGTFQANDFIDINAKFMAINNANTKRIDVYVNSSNSLVGAQRVGLRTITTGSAGFTAFKRTFAFNNDLSQLRVPQPASSYLTDEDVFSATVTTLTYDFSTDVYFIFSATLVDVADTVGIRNIVSQIIR